MIDRNGVKRFGFTPDATIKINKAKPLSFTTMYSDDLNGWLKFHLGRSVGLDGKPTEYFNVYKFFSIPLPDESK